MTRTCDVARKAFPSMLQDDAAVVDRHLAVDPFTPVKYGFSVTVCGERVSIPDRTGFHSETYRRFGLSVLQCDMIDCLLTRDCVGLRREGALRAIGRINDPWVIPFVVALLGDDVVQTLQAIHERRHEINVAAYKLFLQRNRTFAITTRRRAIGHWNRAIRARDIKTAEYVGFDLLALLDLW